MPWLWVRAGSGLHLSRRFSTVFKVSLAWVSCFIVFISPDLSTITKIFIIFRPQTGIMNYQNLLYSLKGMTPQELTFLQQLMAEMTEEQAQKFVMFYSGKRQSPGDILIFTLLGFVGVSGVQRFVTRQIGMGILYFFTAGLCLIGTIVDLINHRSLALDYNQDVAVECAQMARMM